MAPKRHDLPDNTRKAIIALLNGRLADAIDLRLALRHAHEYQGRQFYRGQ
jgi:DNA-binding ferritin-like protein